MTPRDRVIYKRQQKWLESPYIAITERTINGRTYVRARANWPCWPRAINVDVVIKNALERFDSLRDPRLEREAEKKIMEKINLLIKKDNAK